MKNYIINENTLAIVPYNNKAKVIEKYVTYEVLKSCYEIVDESCKYYGSSYNGRCKSTEYLTGFRYKCPIVISENKNIIMFPTHSARKEECIWFNYYGIRKYYQACSNKVVIELANGLEMNILLSCRAFSNQIFKASRLDSIMKSKKN